MSIHPTAMIDSAAEIDPSADIGAYVTVQGPVKIGAGTRIYPYVFLTGATTIGRNCEIHSFASIGDTPQDRGFKNEISYCRIGDENVIREGVSIHRGTAAESSTTVGNRCMFMAYSHIAHNCIVSDDVTMANAALLAGHVRVGQRAFISAHVGVHQFVRIGELAMLGAITKVVMDVPPFFTTGRDGTCDAVNVIGLRRAGFPPAERNEIREAFRLLYRAGKPFRAAVAELATTVQTDAGRRLVKFLQEPSRRGIVSGRLRRPELEAGELELDGVAD